MCPETTLLWSCCSTFLPTTLLSSHYNFIFPIFLVSGNPKRVLRKFPFISKRHFLGRWPGWWLIVDLQVWRGKLQHVRGWARQDALKNQMQPCSHHCHVVMITSGLSPWRWPSLPLPKHWERKHRQRPVLCTPCTSLSCVSPTASVFLFPPHILIALWSQLYLCLPDTVCFLLPIAWRHTQRPLLTTPDA